MVANNHTPTSSEHELEEKLEVKSDQNSQGHGETDSPLSEIADPVATGSELSKDDRRWLKWLKEEGFRAAIEQGISEGWSNQEIVDRLLAAKYGKKGNTEPHPPTLVPAIKRAYEYYSSH